MKKLVVTMLTVLTCGAAYALPVGNPSEASLLTDGVFCEGKCCDWCDPCFNWCDAFSFRVGFYGDYNFNRHMEIGDINEDADRHGGQVSEFQVWTNAGYLALNFCNRADIFATLGASSLNFDGNARNFDLLDTTGEWLDVESETTFSWSVGGRITLWECGCTTLGIEGQYFSFRPDIKRITEAATFTAYPSDDDSDSDHRFSDWQVGLGISHRINMLVPYVAVRWGQASYDADNSTFALPNEHTIIMQDMENSKDWGYAVGVSLVDCEKAMLTVEGRFASEKALYVNGQFRF